MSLLPGTSPLPTPGHLPPDPRALRLGAVGALVTLVVALVLGQVLLPYTLFLAPGLTARVGGGEGAQTAPTFQGFVYPWDKSSQLDPGTTGGYQTNASLENMRSQAKDYHMNTVIIPVVADMPSRSESELIWDTRDPKSRSTLPDADYVRAITDARKAGLVPILELTVKARSDFSSDVSADQVGVKWSDQKSGENIALRDPNDHRNIGPLEHTWFDNYTAFAVHFAQLAATHHLPYFILGAELSSVSYDTDATSAKADPQGIDRSVPNDPCPQTAAGRRDCEWRHVVNAIRKPAYIPFGDHAKSLVGANYTGKLIYAASWGNNAEASPSGASKSEFDHITWWDAINFIGVDATFPLTKSDAEAPVSRLQEAWHGQGVGLAGQGNIYGRIEDLSSKYSLPVVFTSAGYASVPGAASTAEISGTDRSDSEQLYDMQALMATFSVAPWWAGVFWVGDEPVIPRSAQPFWQTSSNWAGDTLATSKDAGKWLNQYYQDRPLPCSC